MEDTVVGSGLFLELLFQLQGGLKAVLWTDTFQMTIVIIGIIVLLVAGAQDAGGFSKVWDIASENGRLEFDKYFSTNSFPWILVIS